MCAWGLWHFNVVGSIDAFPSEKRDNIFSYELLIQKHTDGAAALQIFTHYLTAPAHVSITLDG